MDNVIFNTVEFKSVINQAQVKKGGEVVIKLTADIDEVDMNKLSTLMDSTGGVTVNLEGNQTELVDEDKENDGQLDLLGEEEADEA